ncbi:hypothetical protein JQ604_26510 [Bradyrhizobium jicamae]|uniref:acyl-CoA dehydrogenase family protein n=1 Tax=Bradyrhizobium jicamae TaxID=280332 RepID=UPI001BAD804E|nr:acyl-CoA dehydrogenase family protein [Bradyrhizobium jicamae]MBR0755741.1 hypothetical protein [Bradyrhizobium jicamae]
MWGFATHEVTTGSRARPDLADLVGRVETLNEHFRSIARETEVNRRVPKRSMELLRDAQLFKVMQPAAFGGYEYGPAELARLGYELGRGCGSTAWCGTLTIGGQWIVSFFPEEAQQEVWSDPNGIVAVAHTPSRDCERVSGGFRIAGKWPYVSNCENCPWLIVAAMIPCEGNAPELGWLLLPSEAFTVDQNSWFTCGLQGTGSKTLALDELKFVPEHRVLRFADIASATAPGSAIPENIMARFYFTTFGPTSLAAPILGMARGALDTFTEMARSKSRPAAAGAAALALQSRVQGKIGAAATSIDAALTLLVDGLECADAKLRKEGTLDRAERLAIRRNHGFAAKQAVAVVNELFLRGGASSADLSLPLQRFWRDANTGALHISLDHENTDIMYGQNALGIDPEGMF